MTRVKVNRTFDTTMCHNSKKIKKTPKLGKRTRGKTCAKKVRAKRSRDKPAPGKTFKSSHHQPGSNIFHSPNKPKNTMDNRLPVSQKGKEEYRRTGNLLKALAVDRKLAQSHRSRRRKDYDQKKAASSKNPNSHPDIIMAEDWDEDEDDVEPYYHYRPDWDEEPWYIEALWGNGEAAKWNEDNYVRYGLPCPHVNIKPPIIYHHRSYVDVRYIIPYGDSVINIYRSFI